MEGTELWIFTTSLFFPIFACELVVNLDEEEAGLSNAGVANHEYLEEVVIFLSGDHLKYSDSDSDLIFMFIIDRNVLSD